MGQLVLCGKPKVAVFASVVRVPSDAAKAVGKLISGLDGKLDGMTYYIPLADVSSLDMTFNLEKPAALDLIKSTMKKASESFEYKGILVYTEDQVVSSDFIGSSRSAIFDANVGISSNLNFVKIVAWYDNEYGYSHRIIDLITYMLEKEHTTMPSVRKESDS